MSDPDDRSRDPKLVRDVAALLYAADMMWFREHATPEAQLAWCRRAIDAGDEGEWANGRHSGDCTRRAHTCARCVLERWEAQARRLLSDAEPEVTPEVAALIVEEREACARAVSSVEVTITLPEHGRYFDPSKEAGRSHTLTVDLSDKIRSRGAS